MQDRFFEDIEIGERFTSRGVSVTESMIIEFAYKYDPQPFHIDVVAAKATHFKGLVSSGFLTLALAGRMFLSEQVFGNAAMGASGMDELRWLIPVRPGDTLHGVGQVEGKRPSNSRSDRGYLDLILRVFNQHDDVVMTYRIHQIIACRPRD